jgi:hypothetical protein
MSRDRLTHRFADRFVRRVIAKQPCDPRSWNSSG